MNFLCELGLNRIVLVFERNTPLRIVQERKKQVGRITMMFIKYASLTCGRYNRVVVAIGWSLLSGGRCYRVVVAIGWSLLSGGRYYGIRKHPRRTLPDGHFPDRTLPRPDTFPIGHFPDRTLSRPDTSPTGRFPDRTLTDITLPRLYIFPETSLS